MRKIVLGLLFILMFILFAVFKVDNLYAARPKDFSLKVSSEHRDSFPKPRVWFTVSWDVPDGKRVTVREDLPDGTYNFIEDVYPPLIRHWGSSTGKWSYFAYARDHGEIAYLSNTVEVTVPSPLQPSLLLDDFEDNNFWTPNYSAGWWDSSTVVYQRSHVISPVFSGNLAMQVNYNKSGDPWALFSAYILPNIYRKENFKDYDVITLWAYGEVDLLLKLRDASGQEEDISAQWIDAASGWKKFLFDYSQLTSIDINNIENIMFFVMPGDGSSAGTLYIDEIRLERTRPVLIEDFQDDNFWTPDETVGWWDSSGAGVYRRSRVYRYGDPGRPVMQIEYNKDGDPWSLFSAYISPINPLRDFSRHTKLTAWVRGNDGSRILVKLRDRNQNEEDVSIQQASDRWTKLEFDYCHLSLVDLSDVENILFFIDPGDTSSSGTVYLYDISLE